MWAAVIPGIALTIIQAVIMTRRAVQTGKKLGITHEQFKRAVQSSAAASIGPAIVIATGCITLIVAIGGPMSWMRLAYIGSVAYELITAQLAATNAGATLGAEGMNVNVFATCVWVMSIACLGWILFTALFTHKLNDVEKAVGKGNTARMAIFTTAACLGAYGYLATNQILSSASLPAGFIALIVAGLIQAFMTLYGRKHNVKWMSVWGFTIAMFGGLLAAALVL